MSRFVQCPLCKGTVEMIVDAQVKGRLAIVQSRIDFRPRNDGIRLFEEDRTALCTGGCMWELNTTGDMIPTDYTEEQVNSVMGLRTLLEERALI